MSLVSDDLFARIIKSSVKACIGIQSTFLLLYLVSVVFIHPNRRLCMDFEDLGP